MRFSAVVCGVVRPVFYVLATAAAADAATIVVPAGGNLQTALNAATAGDVITLAAGATYVGNFVLPNKGALTDYITIRSSAPDASLPPAGVRVTPADAAWLPKIRSSNTAAALRTAASTNHWRLENIEFRANQSGYGDIITLGTGDSSQSKLSQVPYAIVLDRLYIHGDPIFGQKRGIGLHSSDTSIINSYVAECKAIGQDSQALSGFNGPGNYLIENNYLEGATENVLFGGADPIIPNLVTSNVIFRRNYLRKPLSWRDAIVATPAAVAATTVAGGGSLPPGKYFYKVVARVTSYQGSKANSAASAEVSATISAATTGGVTISWTPVVGAEDYVVYGRSAGAENMYWKTTNPYLTDTGAAGTAGAPVGASKWSVKNTLELKNAQDVLIEGNVFDNVWVADHTGYPIVFTPRNQGGHAPWAVVQRITFQYNLVRHAAGGVNILGTDDVAPSQRTNNITVRHNVFDDLTSATWGTGGRPFMIGDGPDAVTLDHNTIVSTDTALVWLYGGTSTSPTPVTHGTITNNSAAHNTYGIVGSNAATGLTAINAYLPAGLVSRNVLAGGSASKYPASNYFPSVAAWQGGFVNYAARDYRLNASSPYRNAATDGSDVGADIVTVNAHAANALSGDDRLPPGTSHVQITTTALPDGMMNQYYAQSLTCSGGTTSCAWQLVDSSLPAGLAFDAVAGAVLGTPSSIQTGQLTVSAYDPAWPSDTAFATLSLTIAPPPLVLSMTSTASTQVGTLFKLTPSLSGILGSASWSVVSGALPAGLNFDPLSGTISGMPSAWGTPTVVLQAQDSWRADRVDAKPVTITIAPAPLRVSTAALDSLEYQQPVQLPLAATGGTGAASWSVTGGSLPAGLSLDASGAIVGAPATIGTFQFSVRAIDANWPANVADATLAMVVAPPPLGASVSAPAAAQIGSPYQGAATASGMVGSATWNVVSGALPPGVWIDPATGAIAGVPTQSGSYSAVIQVGDSYDPSRRASASVTVLVAPAAIAITTTTLPNANLGAAFAAALTTSGGSGAVTWSLDGGALPNGVILSPGGALSGVPSSLGLFTFRVNATDAGWPGNVATRTLTLSVTTSDVVLYAADAAVVAGSWTRVVDATAAGSARLWNPDRAAAKLAKALAAPVDYFEMTFNAQAGVAYHLWMRGKADKNNWANDSVYVQFSGAVDASGAAQFRIGTTQSTSVSIEAGLNAGVAGWGWADNAYDGFANPLYFATSGPQTIRVQVREDGLSLDQIVLSQGAFLTASPGLTKNDTTILPR